MAKKDTLIKKIDSQLQGVELAEKMLKDMIHVGMSTIDAKVAKNYQPQLKELGNYYIPGIQEQFTKLFEELKLLKKSNSYDAVVKQSSYIHVLLKKAKDYLEKRKKSPEEAPDYHSEMEELILGKLKRADLKKIGFVELDAEIIQLAHFVYESADGSRTVTEGYWFNIKDNELYKTYKSRSLGNDFKYFKLEEEDYTNKVLTLNTLYKFPATKTHQVEWNETPTEREATAKDLNLIHKVAQADYAKVIKSVKEMLMNPLTDPSPLELLKLHKAYINNNHIVIEDKKENKIVLKDSNESFKTEVALKSLLPANPENLVLLVCMVNDIETGLLYAQPVTLIDNERIINFLF